MSGGVKKDDIVTGEGGEVRQGGFKKAGAVRGEVKMSIMDVVPIIRWLIFVLDTGAPEFWWNINEEQRAGRR